MLRRHRVILRLLVIVAILGVLKLVSSEYSNVSREKSQANSEIKPVRVPATEPPAVTSDNSPAVKVAGLVSSSTGNKISTSKSSFSLESFKAEFPGDWDAMQRPDGAPGLLTGGSIQLGELSAPKALELARRIANQLGTNGDDLREASGENKQTPSRMSFRFFQTYKELPVYQGSLSIFANLPSGEVSLISNELKPISQMEDGPALTQERASRDFEAASGGHETVKSVSGPIYFVSNGVAHPAWKALVHVEGSALEDEVIIDGNSSSVLYRATLGTF